MSDNKRILKNTLLLYVRMFITLGISLFTTRVIFQALGLENMGIYNLVGGVISMLGFLNGSMSSASQRFLSFELGRNNQKNLKEVFELILLIHCILAIIVILLSESFGLWFVNEKLIIAPGRLSAANWVYQTAILSSILGIIKVPFTACIMAHEKMGIYAYFSFIDVVFKLLIVYALWFIPGDNLIIYAILLMLSGAIDFLINMIYCLKKFHECRLHFTWNRSLFKQIFSFSGWNLFGQVTIIANDQVLNIFLNWFYGTIVNGARGIALRINGIIVQFVYQFQSALNPPIVKSFASGNIEDTRKLISRGIKISFLLMMLLSYPFIIETDKILTLWLGESPQYTAWFTRLAIINTLLDTMTGPITTGIQANGKVKKLQIYVSLALITVLPISYLLLKLGIEPYFVILANIFVSFITLYIRLNILQQYTGIKKIFLIKEAILPCYLVAVLSIIPPFLYHTLTINSLINFIMSCLVSIISSIILSYAIGLNYTEKQFVISIIKKLYSKIK